MSSDKLYLPRSLTSDDRVSVRSVFVYFFAYLFKNSAINHIFHGSTELFCPYGGSLPSRFVMSPGPELLSNTLIFINITLISRNWVSGSASLLSSPSLSHSLTSHSLAAFTKWGRGEKTIAIKRRRWIGKAEKERTRTERETEELYKRGRREDRDRVKETAVTSQPL